MFQCLLHLCWVISQWQFFAHFYVNETLFDNFCKWLFSFNFDVAEKNALCIVS